MAKNNRPETYRGRRRKLNVLGIVLSAVAVLIVVLFVLFGSFQKYIVYGNNGISIELPILATPGAAEDEGERVFEQVNAELEITEPDYSDIESQVNEEMEALRAVFVPAESVSTEGVAPYVSKLKSIGGNALVLELKPASGQLVWASSVQLAADYGLPYDPAQWPERGTSAVYFETDYPGAVLLLGLAGAAVLLALCRWVRRSAGTARKEERGYHGQTESSADHPDH